MGPAPRSHCGRGGPYTARPTGGGGGNTPPPPAGVPGQCPPPGESSLAGEGRARPCFRWRKNPPRGERGRPLPKKAFLAGGKPPLSRHLLTGGKAFWSEEEIPPRRSRPRERVFFRGGAGGKSPQGALLWATPPRRRAKGLKNFREISVRGVGFRENFPGRGPSQKRAFWRIWDPKKGASL